MERMPKRPGREGKGQGGVQRKGSASPGSDSLMPLVVVCTGEGLLVSLL